MFLFIRQAFVFERFILLDCILIRRKGSWFNLSKSLVFISAWNENSIKFRVKSMVVSFFLVLLGTRNSRNDVPKCHDVRIWEVTRKAGNLCDYKTLDFLSLAFCRKYDKSKWVWKDLSFELIGVVAKEMNVVTILAAKDETLYPNNYSKSNLKL